MSVLGHLEPNNVWQLFEEICQIPRLSKNEEEIRNYLLDFARKHELEARTDKIGNVLIVKQADPGYENRKTVILQSHMDMVGSKNADHPHSWEKDPITPVIDGEWIRADETTLGADDGIGMAAQLALLQDKELKTGSLECLFTVDEETGMTGAQELDPDLLKGKVLINLDSEDEGELFIGCAGGMDTLGSLDLQSRKTSANTSGLQINLTELHGGHSGDEIHNGYANAIKLMNRLLWNAVRTYEIEIADFTGGNLRNAIPREAFATIAAPKSQLPALKQYIQEMEGVFKDEYPKTEPELKLQYQEVESPGKVLTAESQEKLLGLIYALPHGVIKWSQDMPGLVETSTNLATLKLSKDYKASITTSQRSSAETEKRDIADRMATVFQLAGANAKHTGGYPGWKPNTQSEILQITVDSYKRLFGSDPLVRAIHAGLECGLFLTKYPGLDMISFGPTIKGAHTPQERIDIHTTKKFWDLLLDVLDHIPEK